MPGHSARIARTVGEGEFRSPCTLHIVTRAPEDHLRPPTLNRRGMQARHYYRRSFASPHRRGRPVCGRRATSCPRGTDPAAYWPMGSTAIGRSTEKLRLHAAFDCDTARRPNANRWAIRRGPWREKTTTLLGPNDVRGALRFFDREYRALRYRVWESLRLISGSIGDLSACSREHHLESILSPTSIGPLGLGSERNGGELATDAGRFHPYKPPRQRSRYICAM